MKKTTQSLEQSEAAKRMNLAQWRASRLHELDLPSGLHVTMRDVTMTDLMLTGKLPAPVIDMMNEAAENGNGALDLKELARNGSEFRATLDVLVEITLVEPKIGTTADDEHITLDELPSDDKMAIFTYVNREVEQIKSFREGEAEPVAAV